MFRGVPPDLLVIAGRTTGVDALPSTVCEGKFSQIFFGKLMQLEISVDSRSVEPVTVNEADSDPVADMLIWYGDVSKADVEDEATDVERWASAKSVDW